MTRLYFAMSRVALLWPQGVLWNGVPEKNALLPTPRALASERNASTYSSNSLFLQLTKWEVDRTARVLLFIMSEVG